MTMTRTGLIAVSALVGAAWLGQTPQARADTVTLKNGREIHGRLVEEKEESIRIRTAGGTIQIAKILVATFQENEDWGGSDKPMTLEQQREQEQRAKEAQTFGDGGTAGDSAGGSGSAPKPKPDDAANATGWKWAPGVTEEQIQKLTPLRDAALEELEALGPSSEELLGAIALSDSQRAALKDKIQSMGWRRGTTQRANARRSNNMEEVVEEFGPKAIPDLVRGLSSGSQWVARMSAQALTQIASGAGPKLKLGALPAGADKDPKLDTRKELGKEEIQWLLYQHDVPGALTRLLDHQGEIDSGAIRKEADDALTAITGSSVGYKASADPIRTPAESRGAKAWSKHWTQSFQAWKSAEDEKKEKTTELTTRLDQIKKGVDPAGGDGEDD